MNIKRLLSYGYFFKELPPAFHSTSLGTKFSILPKLSVSPNKCIEFSIPKGQYSRRLLQLPFLNNFVQLSILICDSGNWRILKSHYFKSRFSHSGVIENLEAGKKVLGKDNRAIKTNYDNVNDSKEKAIIDGFDMLYELKVDIAKFYPSIYTHSIGWALLGKGRAKDLWKLGKSASTEPDYHIYKFAETLDKVIMSCQDKQSVGIPIGPDTSHIVAEVIGTYLDTQLKKQIPDLKAIRFFDDYYIYLDSEEKAQQALRFVQQNLAELQLSLNETKLSLRRFPFAFQEKWIKEINDINFRSLNASNLKQYFNTLFDLANQNPDNSNTIFNYGLRRFEKQTTVVALDYWELFESLLLKTMLIEPSVLESSARILETYRSFVNRDRLQSTLTKVLKYHCELNHHYETVWSLWILSQFNLQLPKIFSTPIINSADNFSILMLLSLNRTGLISDGGLGIKELQEVSDLLNSAQTTDWLLYYEAVEVKKWITAKKRIGYRPYLSAGISFFNPKAKIKIFRK